MTTAPPDTRSLATGWTLTREGGPEALKIDFPGDVHSALLAAGLITDPYWRDTEVSLDWIHESIWIAERSFDWAVPADQTRPRQILRLDAVDCHAEVTLNGALVGTLGNRFRRYDLDVTEHLKGGENTLRIRFLSNSTTAKARAASSPIPVPNIWHNRLPHYNFLRKPQCDAGWDWNIALSPLGVYGGIHLLEDADLLVEDIVLKQTHQDGQVRLDVTVHADCVDATTTTAALMIDGQEVETTVSLPAGPGVATLSVTLKDPQLWWPAGHGDHPLYDLEVRLGGTTRRLKVGLREVTLLTNADAIGYRFAFRVNGRDIFMRGANWIPADALPGRATPEAVADLLNSAVMANMNMLRVWGGGTYEPDWFYEMCSERGLMVWQDFMFACNLYPSSDADWLYEVRLEARQNVRRLSVHPCLALWCGDNELVGALGWFDESRADRDRYLAMYARLNFALEDIIRDEAPDVPWWPSSPCVGPLNYGDSWHDDTSGDMHFWDVWHSAKDFEHYRSVRPRFCSEFGFQSFPSPAIIETFTDPKDRNVSSRVMEVHQRNDGGNSRIVETLARYFRFPDDFDDMCFLSQVSQGPAMKTAIEFWRSSKPRTMGTLYWQLNDTWPVASWASLEYGGGWKLTQYMARRFYDPVLVTAQPDPETGDIVLWAVNDTGAAVTLDVTATRVDVRGPMTEAGGWTGTCPPDRAVELGRVPASAVGDQDVLIFRWRDASGQHQGENDYWPARPKTYDLQTPNFTVEETGDTVTLATDVPAFYVTYAFGGGDVWSDNCFTLLPGRPKTLTRIAARSGPVGRADVQMLRG